MKNKEIYIEEQISLVHFNKLLITEDTDSMLKELLNDYDILEIIDIVENYLNKDEFIYFISLFDNLREKLINFIEVVIFAHKRYIKYKSDIDSEYMYEDTLTDLLNMLEFVTKIKEVNKEEYREILLNYKGIPNDNGGLFNLQISYMLDEDVFKYLNGKINDLDIKCKGIYFYSLLSYLKSVKLCLDSKLFLKRANEIIKNIKSKAMRNLILESSKLNYTDICVNDLYADLYGNIEVEDSQTNNIIDIKKYR